MNGSIPRSCYVMLHIRNGLAFNEEKAAGPLVVQPNERFNLNDDIWIERLDEELAKHIQTACEPAHYNMVSDVYDRHLYALLRFVSDRERASYEGMSELHTVAALSRLIHPTSLGGRYCARVFGFGQANSPISAIQYRGVSLDVLLIKGQRDWLTIEDGENLRRLMPWVSPSKRMHSRVHRAYWNHDYALRSAYLDMKWPLVVSGLEALLNAGKDDSGGQFKARARLLADEFQIGLSDDDLDNAWRLRSKLVHAESFLYGLDSILPQSLHSDLYERLELLLRVTTRRCLLDQAFGDFFETDDSVRARWPYRPKPKNSASGKHSKP